jgi:Rrf2 family protein
VVFITKDVFNLLRMTVMNITSKSKYALRAVIQLARAENGGVVRREDLAAAQGGISALYLEKILLRLRDRGFLEAKSGPGGGYRLAVPASELTAWDIIRTVEESPEPVSCLGSVPPRCDTQCEAKAFWSKVWDAAIGVMKENSIAALALESESLERMLNLSENTAQVQCR